jgi:peptidoglycan/LPS O-acetylase OafA/YrhL
MDYRREIDGLRALALLPVILFHAGFETFSGGFVGVDVFFVISGYLITSIILSELEQGKFQIVNFYERRARRILPALFFVMLVCIPFAWFWLLPSDMKDFSKSLVAVPLFASNILFWRDKGYFHTTAELKPLLHTWSLAVEEQFYVLFPLFLMLFWKLGKRWILITLGLVFVASLALAQWAAYSNPVTAFFLLPSRGWELLIGAFAAFYLARTNHKDFGKGLNELCGWFGVSLILYAVLTYSKTTPFPGFYALAPTIGTVLIILFATQQTTVGRFIGNKAFVGIGLISYSAYLWHQPLFAFARHRSLEHPTQKVFFLLFIASLLLAYFTYRFIESPFRIKSKFSRLNIFLASTFFSIFFFSVGLSGHLSNAFAEYRMPVLRAIFSVPDVASTFCHTQGLRTAKELNAGDFCKVGNGIDSFAIIGDSHSAALFTYMDKFLSSRALSALAVSGGFCAPLLNGFEAGENCREATEAAFNHIARDPKIRTVVLVAQWANYTKGFRGNGKPQSWKDYDGKASTPNENVIIFRRSFLKTLEFLEKNNKEVVLIYPVPEFPQAANLFVSKQVLHNGLSLSSAASRLPTISMKQYLERNEEVFGLFNEIKGRVKELEVEQFFCRDQICHQSFDGMLLYSDTNHLNFNGAKMLVPEIFRLLGID